jgi:hypothetical protein
VKTATKEALAVGDRVCAADPFSLLKGSGTIVAATENKAQWLVSWDSGKTWIYHTDDLALVES